MGLQGAMPGQPRVLNTIGAEYIQKYVPWEQQRHNSCHAVQMRKGNKSFNHEVAGVLILLLTAVQP